MKGQAHEIDRVYGIDDPEGRASLWKLLSQLRHSSRWTFRHSIRVGRLARDFARYLGASEKAAGNLGLAVACHDVGKMCIPAEILDKTDRLTPEEVKLIGSHPELGRRMLEEDTHILPRLAALISEGHDKHARTDLPLGAQMASFCDVFDSKTSSRPYRREAHTTYRTLKDILRDKRLIGNPGMMEDFVLFCLGAFRRTLEEERRFLPPSTPPLTPESVKEMVADRQARQAGVSPPARDPVKPRQ